MRISDLTTHVLHDGYRNLLFVRVHTDEGLTGLGEATLLNRTAAIVGYLEAHVKPQILGREPAMGGWLWREVYSGGFIRGGIDAVAGLSAVATAILDIEGKRLGVPAWRLLGGAVHERVPVYANSWYTVEREPSAIAERARQVVGMGYRALKIDPFGAGSYELSPAEERRSLTILGAVRDAVGPDVELFVEGHGRFSTGQATRMVGFLADVRAGWFEEPTSWDDAAAWLEVRRASAGRVPVAGGEHFGTRFGFRDMLANRWVDIAQPDVGLCGGPVELTHIAAMADAFGITVALHDSSGPVSTAASLHAAVTMPNLKIVELFDEFSPAFVRAAVPGHPVLVDGHLPLPTAPGLGVDLDLDAIAEHPSRHSDWNLFAEGWERRFARD